MIQKFKSTNEQKPAYLFVHFKEKLHRMASRYILPSAGTDLHGNP